MASLLAFLVTSAPLAVVVVTASSPTLSSNLRAAYGKAGNTRYRVQISPETNDSPSQYACPSEWDESCQDDPKYRSKLGLSCRFHRTVLPEEKNSCVDWLGAGASWSDGVYDEEDIRNLVKKCPCSCGVKCTAEMDDPTLAPIAPLEFNGKALPNPYVWLGNTDNEENTNDSDNGKREMISREMVWVEIPTPTKSPTALPTDGPTKSPSTTPTKSPTALPTDGPTFAPTSAATRAGFWHTVASLIHDPTAAPVAVNQVPPTAAPTSDGVPLIVASVVQSPQAQDTQHSAPQLLNTPLWMFAAFVAGGMALLVFTIALLSYVRGKRTMHTTNVDAMHKSKAIRQLAESAQDDSIETSPCDHTSEASDAHSKSTASTFNKRRLISSSASNGMSVIVEDDKWTGDGQKTKPETKLEIVKEEKDESIVDWLKARAMEQLEAGHYI